VKYFVPFKVTELEQIVRQAEKEKFNIKAVKLYETPLVTQLLVLIKGAEEPHYHAAHELTVVLLKGKGYLYLDGRKELLKEGDAAFIPRKAVHYYENDAELSVLLATFVPSYDGSDSVKVR